MVILALPISLVQVMFMSTFFSGYYKIGESMSSRPEALQIRELDMKMWKQEGKISSDT